MCQVVAVSWFSTSVNIITIPCSYKIYKPLERDAIRNVWHRVVMDISDNRRSICPIYYWYALLDYHHSFWDDPYASIYGDYINTLLNLVRQDLKMLWKAQLLPSYQIWPFCHNSKLTPDILHHTKPVPASNEISVNWILLKKINLKLFFRLICLEPRPKWI